MATRQWIMRMAVPLLLLMVSVFPVSLPSVAAQGEATLTAEPPAGPPGTVFQLRASGLPPGVGVLASIRGPSGREIAGACLGEVGRDGEVILPPWTTGPDAQAGTYSVQITDTDGATVMAAGTFTVTRTATIRSGPDG